MTSDTKEHGVCACGHAKRPDMPWCLNCNDLRQRPTPERPPHQGLISDLRKLLNESDNANIDWRLFASTISEAIAAIEQQEGWVDVKERLPETAREYLCTFIGHDKGSVPVSGEVFWNGDEWVASYRVIAWRNLPAPFKGPAR